MHKISGKLCLHCETGRQTYMLDEHSSVCPFLNCYSKGRCTMFSELRPEDGTVSECASPSVNPSDAEKNGCT